MCAAHTKGLLSPAEVPPLHVISPRVIRCASAEAVITAGLHVLCVQMQQPDFKLRAGLIYASAHSTALVPGMHIKMLRAEHWCDEFGISLLHFPKPARALSRLFLV